MSRGRRPKPRAAGPDIRVINGEPFVNAELLALLCGITVEEVVAETTRQRQAADAIGLPRMTFYVPKAWRLGLKETQARLGTSDLGEALALLRAEAGR